MDEYSDDEGDVSRGMALGKILVGNDNEILGDHPDNDDDDGVDSEDEGSSDEDHEMEEEMNDVINKSDKDAPKDEVKEVDKREYMPVDVAGLEAMGISHEGGGDEYDDEDDDEDSDADDINLSPDDAIVVVAKTEDDFAVLEVHVYEEKSGNLFVHHDIPLPSFPLCLAHGDINHMGGAGNYIAVGTFSPGIEVWNLDVLNALEPSCILGGDDTTAADELMKMNMMMHSAGSHKKQQQQQPSTAGLKEGSHTDAVMSLCWNKIHRQVIASGSADQTVKIWDITKENANAATFTHHKNKVQAVVWHPTEGTLLATAAYDRTVALLDARSNEDCKKVKITADVESIAWDPHNTHYLTAATEDGSLTCWDVRQFEKPVWSMVVEEYGGVTDLAYNPNVPGMLATCSLNKTVTLWDTTQKEKVPPVACGNKAMEVGKLYTLSFYTSSSWLLGCGGSAKKLALWDMTRDDAIQKRFGERIQQQQEQTNNAVEEEQKKEVDFEAMMTPTAKDDTAALDKAREKSNNNNKKGKKKKGAHKRRK